MQNHLFNRFLVSRFFFITIILYVLTCSNVWAAKKRSLPQTQLSFSQAQQKYWSTYKTYKQQVCKKRTMEGFEKRLKKYRGEGFYLPIINQKIYPDILDGILRELELKRKWLVGSIIKLKKLKRLPRISKDLNKVQEAINYILKLNEKRERFREKLSKGKIRNEKEAFSIIKEKLSSAVNKSYYLTRYRFPVDHFSNRMKHDSFYRKEKSLENKKTQKGIFLLRKLLEDGAPGKSHSGSDKFFRTTLDTVMLELPQMKEQLTESMRYDLEYIVKTLKKLSKNSPWHYVQRFRKWRDQTKEQIAFYKDLKKKAIANDKTLRKKLSVKKQATTDLSSYVYKKQFETYQFWMKQPAYLQALFALETILFNEVGNVDPSGLERSDVLQVVLNRYQQAYYRRLKKDQKLYRLASAQGIKRSQYPWLNILLNRGEFSFVLYYFKASHETFCPNISRSVMKLRNENLKIAYDILKSPRYEFNAERYFSRASMTGRIDMSQIWSNFYQLEERPGRSVSKDKLSSLEKLLGKKKHRYLYSFVNEEQKYFVVEINDKNYVFNEAQGFRKWFEHRNPHYFRYFAVK